MKNPKQKLKKILLLVTVLFTFSCSEVVYEENLNVDLETSVKTTKVSLNQVLIDLNNTAIKKNLNELIIVNSQINSANRVGNSEIYFTKKEKADVLVTYLLNINSYSQEKPYFLKLIITNNANEQCKIGFLKYVPTSPETNLDLHTFTGEVQILNFNFEITAKSDYINGIKQQSGNTSSRITCVNEINVTEVKCSTTGNHGVGEPCKPPFINDAHFVVTIFERCTSRSGDLVQIIEDTSGTGNSNTGGVFPASIILNPFLDTLTSEELEIYYSSPLLQEYLLNYIVVVPNPAYNPLTGGDPNLIIIDPEVESSVKNFITSLAQSGNSAWFFNQTTQTKNSIFNYLIANSFSAESKEFIEDYITNALLNPQSIYDYVSVTPNFKMRKADQIKYPKFTLMVKNLKSTVINNPEILNKLILYSGLSQSQILNKLTFNQGPQIELIPNLTGPSGPNFGNFDPNIPNVININENFALGIEVAHLESTIQATSFLMAITILHEFVHYGNHLTGFDTNGNEMGNLFEIGVYGVIITKDNAGHFYTQLK